MRRAGLGMFLVFFLLGFCSIIIQTTLIREFLVVFEGNELCLGAIFGVWFLWIMIGAPIGSLLSRWVRNVAPLFVVFVLAGALAPFAQIYAIRIVRDIFNVPMSLYVSFPQMLLFALICVAPFTIMIGITFPLGVKVYSELRAGNGSNEADGAKESSGIGWIYVIESLGFLVGGVFFTFLVVRSYMPFLNAAVVLGLLSLLCFLEDMGWLPRWARATFGTIFLLLTVVSIFLAVPLDKYTTLRRWKALKLDLNFVKSIDSKYENLAVAQSKTDRNYYSVLGNGFVMYSFPEPYDHPLDANIVLYEHPNPKKVLLLGNGSHGLIRYMLQHPLDLLVHVELDPAMTELITPYLPEEDQKALEDKRLRHLYGDGRYYVKRAEEKFDVVFANIPDPSSAMINRYYTADFYEEVKKVLAPGGVLAGTMSSAVNYIGEEVGDYAGSLFHTLRDAFEKEGGEVVITPGEHSYFFACLKKGVVSLDGDPDGLLAKRYFERGIKFKNFDEHYFLLCVNTEFKQKWLLDQLMARNNVPRNTDMRPISYFYQLLIWDKKTEHPTIHIAGREIKVRVGPIFRWLHEFDKHGFAIIQPQQRVLRWVTTSLACLQRVLHLHGFVIIIAALLILRALYVLLIRRGVPSQARFNALLSMAACGFGSMVFSITLLFAFQNLYGYLYHMIGLITALFMFGLAMGGMAMTLLLRRTRTGNLALLIVLAVLVVYGVVLPMGIEALASGFLSHLQIGASQVCFMVILALGGSLTGLAFPLATRVYFEHSRHTGVTAGLVHGADHGGACLGSFLSGTILVPIMGLAESCLLVAVIAGACLILQGILVLRERRTSCPNS